MIDSKKIFSERLRQVRQEKGLTLEKLGEKISLGKTAIHNLENENMPTLPSFNVLLNLADALDVSVDFLLGRSDSPKVHKPRKDAPS